MQNYNEDEFEREMEAEAELILEQAVSGFRSTSSTKPCPLQSSERGELDWKEREASAKGGKEFYNEVYFDSSSSEGEEEGGEEGG